MPDLRVARPDTIRTRLEAIRDRHDTTYSAGFSRICEECGRVSECPDHRDAVAALDLLDAADIACRFYGNPGTCTADKLPQLAALKGSEILGRVVPDPERDAK